MSCFCLTLAKKVFCLLAAFAGRVKVHPCHLFQAREHPPTPPTAQRCHRALIAAAGEVSASCFVLFSPRPVFRNDLIVLTGGLLLLHDSFVFWAGECLQTPRILWRAQKLSRQQRISEYRVFYCSFLLITAKNTVHLHQQVNLHVLIFDFCAYACFGTMRRKVSVNIPLFHCNKKSN